jgi:hypothetical protein
MEAREDARRGVRVNLAGLPVCPLDMNKSLEELVYKRHHVGRVRAVQDHRTSQREAPAHHVPGPPTSAGLDIEEVRTPLEDTRHLRLALDLLEERLPPAYNCDGLESELWALREKIDAAQRAQLRAIGHREYLV